MRRSLLVLLVSVALPSSAAAAPVLFLARDGKASLRDDPFLAGPAQSPAAATATARRGTGAAHAHAAGTGGRPSATGGAGASGSVSQPPAHVKRRRRRRPRPPEITIVSELSRLLAGHAITPAAYDQYSASLNAALAAAKRLRGTRRDELVAVTETLHQIAASKQMTPSRLPVLFQTLDRNRQWWTSGPLLSSGERVEFAGSQLVWEYYRGQGIQLQVLGSFGKANGLYTAGLAEYPALEQLLAQIIPLAGQRAGGIAWEYYFSFDGGSPPWASAMAQATGLEALARAYQATANPYYLQVAAEALPLFTQPPPVGVAVAAPAGTRYLQYTFAPGTAIINAFLQTLIGLDSYATVSGSPVAQRLFAAGNAEALAELPGYDTGAWSLYQPGIEDDLSYHQLVTGFLGRLCTLTAAPLYCFTAARFDRYLTTPPVLTPVTFRARAGKTIQFAFQLSKYSHVAIVVSRGAQTLFATSASFPYGIGRFAVGAPKHPGTYPIVLTATDLAGNFTRTTGTLAVARAPRRPAQRLGPDTVPGS